MTRTITLSLFVLLLLSQTSYPNTRLFPGYYVNNNGDSLYCDFEFGDWRMTPKKVVANISGKTLTLGPSDIKRFGIFGYGDYISARVSYHLSDISQLNIPDEFSDSIEIENSFIKILNEGTYSLFELARVRRTYYFVSENNGAPAELVYRLRRKNMQIEEDDSFRKTLFNLFVKEGLQHDHMNRINKAAYTNKDIASLVRTLNSKYSRTQHPHKKASELEMDLFIGGITNFFPSTVIGSYSAGNRFDNSDSFSGGLNLLYILPAHFKSFAVGVSAGFNQYKTSTSVSGSYSDSVSANYHSTTTFDENFFVENKLILISLYGRYTINPLSKIKAYVKAGVNCNLAIGSKDMFSTHRAESKGVRNGNVPTYHLSEGSANVMQLRGMYYNLRGDAGVATGRHKLEVSYFTPATLNPHTSFKIGMIGAHYYFTIMK